MLKSSCASARRAEKAFDLYCVRCAESQTKKEGDRYEPKSVHSQSTRRRRRLGSGVRPRHPEARSARMGKSSDAPGGRQTAIISRGRFANRLHDLELPGVS